MGTPRIQSSGKHFRVSNLLRQLASSALLLAFERSVAPGVMGPRPGQLRKQSAARRQFWYLPSGSTVYKYYYYCIQDILYQIYIYIYLAYITIHDIHDILASVTIHGIEYRRYPIESGPIVLFTVNQQGAGPCCRHHRTHK